MILVFNVLYPLFLQPSRGPIVSIICITIVNNRSHNTGARTNEVVKPSAGMPPSNEVSKVTPEPFLTKSDNVRMVRM